MDIHLSPRWMPADFTVLVCPVYGCEHWRRCSTLTGHRNGLIQHLMDVHRIRVFFDRRETSLSEIRERTRRAALRGTSDRSTA